MFGVGSEQELTDRLRGLPRPVMVLLAARAALRVLPLIRRDDQDRLLSTVAISVFRANAIAWVAGTGRPASYAAATRAADAVTAVTAVTDAHIIGAARAAAASFVSAGAAASAAADAASADAGASGADNAAAAGRTALDTAARAATRANAVADNIIRKAFDDDISFVNELDHAIAADRLAHRPLWPSGQPDWAASAWAGLKVNLLHLDPSWQVWTTWYEARILAPGSSPDPALEDIVHDLPEDFWDRSPGQVNADLLSRANAIRTARLPPPEPIPRPGPGPHVEIGPDGRIRAAPPSDIDAEGNNIRRIRQFLPLVREAAEDLALAVGQTNAFPELTRDLHSYRNAIAGEPETIAWGTVWMLGVRLEATADAVAREQPDRLRPEMEDDAHAALNALVRQHGPLILSTAEGLELQALADDLDMTRDQQAALQTDTVAIANALLEHPEIIEKDVAETVLHAAEAIGQGRHPERTTTAGTGIFRNVSIVMIAAASVMSVVPAAGGLGWLAGTAIGGGASGTIGAAIGSAIATGPAVVGFKSLERSETFVSAVAALGRRWEHLFTATGSKVAETLRSLAPFRAFVRTNEAPLRRIAANTSQLRWMTRYIDFIVRPDDNGATTPDTSP